MNKISFFYKICRHLVHRSTLTENILKPRHLCTTVRKFQNQGTEISKDDQSKDKRNLVLEEEEDYIIASDKRIIPQISWDKSMRYMESEAYKGAYGDDVVWKHYRRNFKGYWRPDTREKCIRYGKIVTGSPCPLCRDEYLVVDYRNIKLLQQFVNSFTGELYPTMKTGVCQKRFTELRLHLSKAIDYGFMRQNLDFRHYDSAEYLKLAKKSIRRSKRLAHQNKQFTDAHVDTENTSLLEEEDLETMEGLSMSEVSHDKLDLSEQNVNDSTVSKSMQSPGITSDQTVDSSSTASEASSESSSSESSDSESSDSDNEMVKKASSADDVVEANSDKIKESSELRGSSDKSENK